MGKRNPDLPKIHSLRFDNFPDTSPTHKRLERMRGRALKKASVNETAELMRIINDASNSITDPVVRARL